MIYLPRIELISVRLLLVCSQSVSATASDDSFFIEGADGSDAVIRHLGTSVIEVLYRFANTLYAFFVQLTSSSIALSYDAYLLS